MRRLAQTCVPAAGLPQCPRPSSTFYPHARRTGTATRCCSWRRPKHCASPRPACSWTCCDARRAAPARHKTDCPAVGCRTAGPVPATWTVRGEAGAEAAVTKVCDIPDVNIAVDRSNVASTVPVVLVVRRAARHGLLMHGCRARAQPASRRPSMMTSTARRRSRRSHSSCGREDSSNERKSHREGMPAEASLRTTCFVW